MFLFKKRPVHKYIHHFSSIILLFKFKIKQLEEEFEIFFEITFAFFKPKFIFYKFNFVKSLNFIKLLII